MPAEQEAGVMVRPLRCEAALVQATTASGQRSSRTGAEDEGAGAVEPEGDGAAAGVRGPGDGQGAGRGRQADPAGRAPRAQRARRTGGAGGAGRGRGGRPAGGAAGRRPSQRSRLSRRVARSPVMSTGTPVAVKTSMPPRSGCPGTRPRLGTI